MNGQFGLQSKMGCASSLLREGCQFLFPNYSQCFFKQFCIFSGKFKYTAFQYFPLFLEIDLTGFKKRKRKEKKNRDLFKAFGFFIFFRTLGIICLITTITSDKSQSILARTLEALNSLYLLPLLGIPPYLTDCQVSPLQPVWLPYWFLVYQLLWQDTVASIYYSLCLAYLLFSMYLILISFKGTFSVRFS